MCEQSTNRAAAVMKDSIDLCGAVCSWVSSERPQFMSGRYMAVHWDVDELKAKEKEIVESDKLKFRMVV